MLHALDASAIRYRQASTLLAAGHEQYREFFENAGGSYTSQQVLAKKADRLRIVKMDPVRDLPAAPPAAATAAGDKQ